MERSLAVASGGHGLLQAPQTSGTDTTPPVEAQWY